MRPEEFLNQPYNLYRKIKVKEQKAIYYRELSMTVSSPGFEEHYSATKNLDAPFVRYIHKAEKLEQEIKADYVRLALLKEEVDRAIDEQIQDETEAMVLRYRYVMLMSVRQIATKMSYTKRWVQLIHAKAVTRFETFRTNLQ